MTTLDAAAIELADSLPVDAVPAKLRCGSCNKIAVNAVKLPCCDQNICEPCSQDLPDTCPICSHSPLSAADCKQNKSLRMTVKAFIKHEEKRISKEAEAQASEAADAAAVVSGDAASEAVNEGKTSAGSPGAVNGHAATRPVSIGDEDDSGHDHASAGVHDSHDVQSNTQVALPEGDGVLDEEEEEDDDDDDVVITTERPEHEMEQSAPHRQEDEYDQGGPVQEQDQVNGQQGYGFDQNQNFANMDFTNMNNFNPMMTAMQGGMGMPNFGMGMPNMMGMAGMNMDPTMMFSGGFGGMGGMNDMSSMMGMGMGMNGMGNFAGMPGMGMNGGPSFFPPNGVGGYNQQNFGSHMNQNFHHNRGYGRPYNRGYGRGGRGYYSNRGRGGGWQNYGQYHGQSQNQNFMNQQYQQQQNLPGNDENFDAGVQQSATRGSPSYEPMKTPDGTTSDAGQQKNIADVEHADDTNNEKVNAANETGIISTDAPDDVQSRNTPQLAHEEGSEDVSKESEMENVTNETTIAGAAVEHGLQNESVDVARPTSHGSSHDIGNHEAQSQYGYGYGSRGRGGFRGARGGFRGQGSAYGHFSTLSEREVPPAAAPPINAPTGPKAMRAGLPNSGWYSRPQQHTAPAATPLPEPEKPKDIEPDTRSRTESRSRSASRNQNRNEKRKSSDGQDESEEAYERRKDRERRKRKERDERYDERDADVNGDESRKKTRSRSESRDEGRSKRRTRDKDEERHSSRSRRDRSRDRRKHRHRSRSPERSTDVNGDGYESSRRKHRSDRKREDDYESSDRAKERSRRLSRRDDDYEQDGKDRSTESSRHERPSRDEREREKHKSVAVVEEPEEEFEFKIKGKSASMKQGLDTSMGPPTPATLGRERNERRSSVQASTPVTLSTPIVDPYAADRENARKKREAEQQKKMEGRRQSSQSLGKHSRDDNDEVEAPIGPRGDSGRSGKRVRKDVRRHSLKYEGEVGDGADERDNRRWR